MKYRRALACILSATLVCCSFTACGIQDSVEQIDVDENNNKIYEDIEASELNEIVSKVVNTGSSNAQKEETVYVKTNANGTVDSVVVSNWLKNVDNTEELTDYTDLTNITNVKGKETFTDDNGELVWKTEGNDIYYQGTTDKQLPVDVSISYALDGNSIAADNLKGKNGHLKITIDYINNLTQQVTIGEKEETIYTPFAVVSGLMLDSDNYSNVSVSNGTVIADGKREIVVGMAFPGLVDSLNGQKVEDDSVLAELEDKVSIPSNVVIEADVTDYQPSMILTMVSSDIINALGFEDISVGDKFEDVKDKVNEFSDAGDKLVDGTGKLKAGVSELANGTTDLVSGTNKLHDGVVAYTDGVSKVAEGASKLNDGAAKLDNGAGELQNGISAVDSGVDELKNGIDKANNGAGALTDGAAKVDEGAKAVSAGAQQVSAGVDSLTVKMGQIASGVGEASNAASQISGGIDQVVAATSVQTSPEEIDTSFITVSGCIDSSTAASLFIGNIPSESLDSLGLTEEQRAGLEQIISGVAGQVIPSVADNAATGAARQAAASAAANAANQVKGQINAAVVNTGLQAGASQLASSLSASYSTLVSDETQAQLNALKAGAATVAGGASQVADGTGSLKDGAKQLYDGTKQLSEGSAKLKNGTKQLSDGASTLKNGTSELKAGTGTLVNGTSELNANSAALRDGSKTLADGSVTLVAGISQLLNGATELNNGMIEFNEDGISKLTQVFDTDMVSMSERIKAISEAGKTYKSFGGSSQNENSKVKFVIESM